MAVFNGSIGAGNPMLRVFDFVDLLALAGPDFLLGAMTRRAAVLRLITKMLAACYKTCRKV